MGENILQDVWKLRTDPFFPNVDATGATLPQEALEQTLDPLVDPRVVNYYFDVYDWSRSQLIRGLSRQSALSVFPKPRDLPQSSALMVLISGSMQTGRDSLANLLAHKVKEIAKPRPPLVVEIPLDGLDRAANLKNVAMQFIYAFEGDAEPVSNKADIVKQMWDRFDRFSKEESGRRDATYSGLFSALNLLFKPMKRPLILRITSGGDHDSWIAVYNATKTFCTFLIVLTSDPIYAQTCYGAMTVSNQSVAWIKATPLGREAALRYLQERLEDQRIAGVAPPFDELHPFTRNAIDELFARGSSAKPDQAVTYSIGWLRRTLGRAISNRMSELDTLMTAQAPADVGAIDPAAVQIDADHLLAAREQLNQGE